MNYFHARWPSCLSRVTYQIHEGKYHGIEIDKIDPRTTLVLCPDAGSNQYDVHKELKERGIETLILDHHHTPVESEDACVVNNQMCDYPTKSLCGCAIVYKLFQYIDKLLDERGFVDQFLDIVAVSLVSDMMDLQDFETHYLVQEGLKSLRNPFIKGMVEKNAYSIGQEVTPIGIAFYVTPLINSITRVGTMEEKILLFESMLEYEAYKEVPSTKRGCKGQYETKLEQSLRTCSNVKNYQTKQQTTATVTIDDVIQNEGLLENKILLIKLDSIEFDRSIVGLIANRLMAQYKKPTLLLVKTIVDGKVYWNGSGRCPGKCGLADFREFCEQSGLVEYASGHGLAFGFSISDEKVCEFIEYSNEKLKDVEFSPRYKVDFIFSSGTVKPSYILSLGENKALWGQSLDEPLIAVENIAVTKDMLSLMSRDKNPTLKIELPIGVSCIKFKSSEEEYESLYSKDGCVNINLIGKCEVNRYYDKVTPQLIVQDYEIISKQDYYF